MPYIKTSTNLKISEDSLIRIKIKFGEAIKILNKTEDWLMLEFNDNANMFFRGNNNSSLAFIEVKVLGNVINSNEMTKALTNIISEELNIHSNNIYIAYQGYSDWGYNGNNF